MDINVFDEKNNVVKIKCQDIIKLISKGKRMYYKTESGMYHGSVSLSEEAKLRTERDFILIDKNCLVNLEKVDNVENGCVYIGGSKYPISRRRRAEVLKIWLDVRSQTDKVF